MIPIETKRVRASQGGPEMCQEGLRDELREGLRDRLRKGLRDGLGEEIARPIGLDASFVQGERGDLLNQRKL